MPERIDQSPAFQNALIEFRFGIGQCNHCSSYSDRNSTAGKNRSTNNDIEIR